MKLKNTINYQIIIIIASILPIIVFGFITYHNQKSSKVKATFEHLVNINKQKRETALEYFKGVESDTKNLRQSILFLQKQATKNIINLQQIQKQYLLNQYGHISINLKTLSQKDLFQYVYKFLSKDRAVEPKYLRAVSKYAKELQTERLFMINNSGKIVYSSKNKRYKNRFVTEISPAFRRVWKQIKSFKNKKRTVVLFVQPAYDNIANSYKQFAITKFRDVEGFVALEINTHKMQNNMPNTSLLGKSAETYLIYKEKNKTYLATQRHVKQGKVGEIKSGKYINLGFKSSGTAIKVGSTGAIEMDGYTPITLNNILFSMQTTVSYTDIISPVIHGADYFEQFLLSHEYQNISLISKEGEIFYATKKDSYYKTNILQEKYSQTFLAKAVKKVFESKKFLLTDIGFYSQSSKELSQFAIIPILDKDSKIQTIAILQLKLHKLSKKMQFSSIYKTNETYLVGKDLRLRSDTFINKESYNMLNSYTHNLKIGTVPVKLAFKNIVSTNIAKDYRGENVLSSFSHLQYSNVNWAVITKIDETEIETTLNALKLNIYTFVLIASFIVLFVMILITNEKKKNDKKLKHQAMHDSLTELPNRKYALEFLALMLAKGKRNKQKGAVLFIDLDKFKLINDTYGHKAGDFVLQEVSKRIKRILREYDLLARLGGDEFIVILDDYKTQNDIDKLCNKIINSLLPDIIDNTLHYKIGLSIGVATFPDDSNDAVELLMFADTAMFKTKDNGRNNYTFYNSEMTQNSLRVARVEKDLAYAIEHNELVLHYQPQVDLQTNRVVGTEALVRWNHPIDGFIMPNDFIPIAENSNLIVELGYWVLQKACEDFLSWKTKGYEMDYVAVNMSSKQLQSLSCVQNVMSILDKLSFNPEWVELEITETTLISNFESTINNINTFKEKGIKFSIDDFGTGYSSLSYLKTLRISTLKIDREFIKDIIAHQDSRTIVTAIIAMGHALSYTIVAEGAETKAEIELLKYLACDVVQGYYHSKPLEETKLLEFIDARR